jgi:hypothetical protein
MNMSDVVYILGAMLAAMIICSLPMLGSRRRAGPHYRAIINRQLLAGWSAAVGFVGWLILGWFAIAAAGSWFGIYRDVTLVLMGVYFPLLWLSIRAGNQSLAAARAVDDGLVA